MQDKSIANAICKLFYDCPHRTNATSQQTFLLSTWQYLALTLTFTLIHHQWLWERGRLHPSVTLVTNAMTAGNYVKIGLRKYRESVFPFSCHVIKDTCPFEGWIMDVTVINFKSIVCKLIMKQKCAFSWK